MRLSRPLLVAAMLLATLTSACRVSLGSDIEIEGDGSGTFAFAIAVDDELDQLLADAGVDLTLGLTEADAVEGWEVEQLDLDDGRQVVVRTDFEDADDLSTLVDELHSGLGPDDPAVLRDVSLRVDDEGRAELAADAGLLLPTTTGAEGDGVAFDGEDLAALIEREGAKVARYDLRVTLPGTPRAHNADARDGRELTWTLPIGEMRAISASSEPPADRTWALVGATFLVSAAAAALVVVVSRRRGSRLAGARAERPSRG